MTFDDPAILSAYLDGELGAAELRSVEAALRRNPRLAGELAELRRVRDTLSALPAAVPPRSCRQRVVFQLAALSRRNLRFQRQTRVAMLWVSLGVIAACFFMAWSLQVLQLSQSYIRNGPYWVPPSLSRAEPPAAELVGPPLSLATLSTDSDAYLAFAPEELLIEQGQAGLRNELRAFLDQGDARRLVVAVDALQPQTVDALDRIVNQTPRANARHARLALAPGVVFDPARPGAATVFALVLDDAELANLRERLGGLKGASVLAEEPAPLETVALLAEAAAVEFGRVDPTGTVIASGDTARPGPSHQLALRESSTIDISGLLPRDDRSLQSQGPPSALDERGGTEARRGRVSPEVVPLSLHEVLLRLERGRKLMTHDEPGHTEPARHVCLIWIIGS